MLTVQGGLFVFYGLLDQAQAQGESEGKRGMKDEKARTICSETYSTDSYVTEDSGRKDFFTSKRWKPRGLGRVSGCGGVVLTGAHLLQA